MPMPDWFDPSMLYGGAGMMSPPGLLQPQQPPGLPAQGQISPPQFPPIPAPPQLPGITPQAAVQAGAPLTFPQQMQALQNAGNAFSQIRPPMPAGGMSPAPSPGSAGLPPGIGMPARRPMPMPPGDPMAAAGMMNPALQQQLQQLSGPGQMAGQGQNMLNPMMQVGAAGAGGINPSLMQMLRLGLGSPRPPLMGGPYGGGMGIY